MPKKKEDHIIVAVHVTDRAKQASRVQSILTKYGGFIKTRIGLHEAKGRTASPNGLILLELVGAGRICGRVSSELNAIAGVEAKTVVFEH